MIGKAILIFGSCNRKYAILTTGRCQSASRNRHARSLEHCQEFSPLSRWPRVELQEMLGINGGFWLKTLALFQIFAPCFIFLFGASFQDTGQRFFFMLRDPGGRGGGSVPAEAPPWVLKKTLAQAVQTGRPKHAEQMAIWDKSTNTLYVQTSHRCRLCQSGVQ